jgi:hypothetical protein
MTAAQIADVKANTALVDVTAAIQTALTAARRIYFPAGTYLVTAALLPRTTQTLYGDGVNQTVLKAGTVGMTVLNYPSGAYSNVVIRDLTIRGDSKAERGLSMIAASQGAISNCEFHNVQMDSCTLYQAFLSQATYCVIDRCVFGGAGIGDYGLYLDRCFSSEIKNSIITNSSEASLMVARGSQITFSKTSLFNEAVWPSTALAIIDGGHTISFLDCEFEPQGAANVTYEVILRDTFVGGNCTDNSFTRCKFIGVANTKTNCLAIGTSGAVYKTRIVECGFIKPTSTSSILLTTQAETSISRSYDLVTYDTPVYAPVTVTNSSGNGYFGESLVGVFDAVTTKSHITFPATQVASSGANVLDDYEEGTWTPTLTPSSSGTITLETWPGGMTYTKVGRMVHVCGGLVVQSVSSPVGTVTLGGLPFASRSGQNALAAGATVVVGANSGLGSFPVMLRTLSGTTTARISKLSTGTSTTIAEYFQAGMEVIFSITYPAAD